MKIINLSFLFVALGWLSVSAQELDSLTQMNIIDVDVVSLHETKDPLQVIPRRVAKLNQEKEEICGKISDYKAVLRGSRKKDLMLTSTGYYKPTVTRGMGDLKTSVDRFSAKVDEEISYVLAFNQSDYSITYSYVLKLEKMRSEVSDEYKKVPALLKSKLR